MNVVRVCTRFDSDMLRLPQLEPLLGKDVEIIVRLAQPTDAAGASHWEAAAQAAEALRETGYDFEAWREQRQFDQQHAARHSL